MSPDVDRTLISKYLTGELDDAASATVEEHVATSEAWATALREEAQMEMAMFEVVDAIPEIPAKQTGWLERVMQWFRQPAGLTTLMAVAAALLLVVRMGPSDAPAYQMEVNSGEVEVRSADRHREGPAVYSNGSALDLSLVPEQEWTGTPDVTVLLDGEPLDGVEISSSAGGVVRVYGVWGEGLPTPTPGAHSVAVVLEMPDGTATQHVHAMVAR